MAEYLGEPEIRDAVFAATDDVINEGKIEGEFQLKK